MAKRRSDSDDAPEAESTEETPKRTVKKPKFKSYDEPAKVKKPKYVLREGNANPDQDEGSGVENRATGSTTSGAQMNDDGEEYIELGKKKRATVRSFKSNVFLDIREYFGSDGEEKPGRKGITLSKEQWHILKNHAATIDTLFARK